MTILSDRSIHLHYIFNFLKVRKISNEKVGKKVTNLYFVAETMPDFELCDKVSNANCMIKFKEIQLQYGTFLKRHVFFTYRHTQGEKSQVQTVV